MRVVHKLHAKQNSVWSGLANMRIGSKHDRDCACRVLKKPLEKTMTGMSIKLALIAAADRRKKLREEEKAKEKEKAKLDKDKGKASKKDTDDEKTVSCCPAWVWGSRTSTIQNEGYQHILEHDSTHMTL